MTNINGGFFWAQRNGAISTSANDAVRISNSVIYGRPRWWQIRRWYRALRYWLALPSA